MTALNKQALREAATEATQGGWYVDYDFDVCHESGAFIAETHGDNLVQNAKFIAAANPSTVLALLNENLQLQRDKDSLEAVAIAMRDDMRDAREKLEAAERRIAELEARAVSAAATDVLAERQRQISMEGWKPEHDDEYCNGELAMAAVCYINETGTVNRNGGKPWGWPWDASWWKPKTRRRNLVKAGALILAEIERLDRAAGIGVKGE